MRFPKWLPEDVAAYVQFELSDPDNDYTPIKRLVTDPLMEKVWKKLSVEAPNAKSQRVEALIDDVVSLLNYWDTLSQSDLLLTPKEQEKHISEFIAAIDKFEDTLDKNALLLVDYWTDRSNPINYQLNEIRNDLKKYEHFWEELPPKMHAKNAKRTFFMRGLKRSLTEQYGQPFPSLVAVITCVVLDEAVTVDDAKKA